MLKDVFKRITNVNKEKEIEDYITDSIINVISTNYKFIKITNALGIDVVNVEKFEAPKGYKIENDNDTFYTISYLKYENEKPSNKNSFVVSQHNLFSKNDLIPATIYMQLLYLSSYEIIDKYELTDKYIPLIVTNNEDFDSFSKFSMGDYILLKTLLSSLLEEDYFKNNYKNELTVSENITLLKPVENNSRLEFTARDLENINCIAMKCRKIIRNHFVNFKATIEKTSNISYEDLINKSVLELL